MRWIFTILLASIVLAASGQTQLKTHDQISMFENQTINGKIIDQGTTISFSGLKGIDTSYWGDQDGIFQVIQYKMGKEILRVENKYIKNQWQIFSVIIEERLFSNDSNQISPLPIGCYGCTTYQSEIKPSPILTSKNKKK